MFMIQPMAAAAPSITESGIPATASAGEPVHLWVNISSGVPIHDVLLTWRNPANGDLFTGYMNLSEGNTTSGKWTYDIPAQPWKGELECKVTAKDDYGYSAFYPASGFMTIEILGETEPKEFPWNLVIIIIFLGAVLVLTELVFKPGFYRKTGREKARELEEEDRLRELEEKEN